MEKENIVEARNASDTCLEVRSVKEAGMSEELQVAIQELIQRLRDSGPIETGELTQAKVGIGQ